ncbi:MAG: futalosine hydrolase [Bacteroidetes bacterium]|nr:futalosine hydrolase [Bacteroidota bacterium]
MRFLLVAATTFEVRPILDRLTLIGRQDDYLSLYQYHSHFIDVLIPGIGMVPTAYHLGRQLAVQQYDLAINAGIAGTFNKSLPIGTVVNVVEDCVPELGAEDGDRFLSVFELGLSDPDAHPYHGGKLTVEPILSEILKKYTIIGKLPYVKAITSNTVRGNGESIDRILRISPADIESMEGAAFFYACLSGRVPCLQIRSISNLVEERDKSRWNLDLALKNLNRILWKMVTSPTLGN